LGHDEQAQTALDDKAAEVRQELVRQSRLDADAEDVDDTRNGWLADYQTFTTRSAVTPMVNGRLDHDKTMWLRPGDLPEFE